MTSSNGNIFCVTGPLCWEFTGPGEFPAQRPVTRSFDVFFDLRRINDWVNNREAGDLRRYRGHYDVIVMDGEYILVCEELNNRIQVFKHDGTIVSIIENSNDPLLAPSGLAVTKDVHVYVVDTMHDCIKKYKYKDLTK